jgi:spore coat protein CotH
MRLRHLPWFLILFCTPVPAQEAIPAKQAPKTQGELFGLDKIWDVKITVEPDVWKTMFPKRRPPGTQRTNYTYVAGRVRIAGHPELEVGLRFKGNSTFWMTAGTLKRSFKIDFDRLRKGQKFLGLKKLNLNNNSLDGTQIREAISYQAYRESGVPASRAAFARVFLTIPGKVDDEYIGFYTIIEQVDRGFLQRNLGQKGALMKPTWSVLGYHGDAWNPRYARDYVPKAEVGPAQMQPVVDLAKLNHEFRAGWSDAEELSDTEELEIQSRFAERLERVMDVGAFLRYIAVTTLIGNMDSPFLFPHNYYLVIPDETKRVQWVPWDLNNALGGLGIFVGNKLHQQSIDKPTRRAIIARVLEVQKYRDRYRKIVAELIKGPCSAQGMVAKIELADRTSRAAKAREKTCADIVNHAGELGGNKSSRRAGRRGLGGSSRITGLTKFVRAREKSVLDQLAGRSEGIAARPSVLDAMLNRQSRRSGSDRRREPDDMDGREAPDDCLDPCGEAPDVEPTSRPVRPQGFGSILPKTKLVARFDENQDGRLDRKERDKSREALRTDAAAQRRQRTSRTFRGAGDVRMPEPVAAAKRIRASSAKKYAGRSLYDPKILRTLFLDFERDDWFEELTTFYRTDVEIPATLIADGKKYAGVGVHFRGSSSYLMVRSSLKKSFNVSMDHSIPRQRLEGFRTLNLLNGNQDSTFIREVMFSHVARNYIPVPRVNYVKVVINGANWGVYQNAEQFNKDYLKDAYGTRGGVRWKVHRNQRGVGALTYRGDDPADYSAYELRTKRSEKKDANAWKRLVSFCKVLNDTPTDELHAVLPKVLDIDEVLWYCALENVFLPSDGYMNQGYDYRLYEDKSHRFHLISHDCNEILQTPTRRRGRGRASLTSGPLFNSTNRLRPILHRLLAVPEWRARYLAHVRTIAVRWLNWKVIGPVCKSIHELIADEVAKDDKKLFSTRTWKNSLEDGRGYQWPLRRLVEERRENLLSHAALLGPWPELSDVKHEKSENGVMVRARVGGKAAVSKVLLHFRAGKSPIYKVVGMHDDGKHGDGAAGDGVFGASIPPIVSKRPTTFYVEARADTGTVFHPEHAEAKPLSVR